MVPPTALETPVRMVNSLGKEVLQPRLRDRQLDCSLASLACSDSLARSDRRLELRALCDPTTGKRECLAVYPEYVPHDTRRPAGHSLASWHTEMHLTRFGYPAMFHEH